jgi:hypothetical protein
MHAMRLPAWFMNLTRLLAGFVLFLRESGTREDPERRAMTLGQ